jgi:hypothetical protein
VANQLVDDRHRLVRCGDYDSEANQKIRKAAFNLSFAIAKAFLPDIPTDGFNLLLTGCFRIKTRHIIEPKEWFVAEVEMYEYAGFGHHEKICYWHISDKGEIHFSDGCIASLNAARIIAEHITHGWLPKVITKLANEHGRETATKLAEELGLPMEISAS